MNVSDFLAFCEDMLSSAYDLRISIAGASMSPSFRSGDIVIIKSANAAEVAIGDIIVCRSADGMIAHRLIRKYKNNGNMVLVTKGNSLPNFDNPVFPEDVLGKVVAIERGKRKINLDNPLGRLTNLFLAKISPFSPWFYPVLRKANRGVRKVLSKVWLTGLFR